MCIPWTTCDNCYKEISISDRLLVLANHNLFIN